MNGLYTAYSVFVMKLCLWGMAAIATGVVFAVLAREAKRYAKTFRRVGFVASLILGTFIFGMIREGTVTQEDKEEYRDGMAPIIEERAAIARILLPTDSDDLAKHNDSSKHEDDLNALAKESDKNTDSSEPGQDLRSGQQSIAESDYEAGIVLAEVRTNEVHDFTAPTNAVWQQDWLNFGGFADNFRLEFEGLEFPFGTNSISALTVFQRGLMRPRTVVASSFIAPMQARLGAVPSFRHSLLPEANRPSGFWHCFTPSNSVVMTWRNFLLGRDALCPVTLQAELFEDGCAEFRYDLSQAGADTITNIAAGIRCNSLGTTLDSLDANVTTIRWQRLNPDDVANPDPDNDGISTCDEIFVYRTDPYNADSDYDGISDYDEINVHNSDPNNPHSLNPLYCDSFALVLGDEDPFACPEGSTNTIYEHIVYTGTTNAPFAYPVPTDEIGVLKIMVSGSGAGRLVVGDVVVPLLGSQTGLTRLTGLRGGANPDNPLNPVTNTLLLVVGKGVRETLWWEKPDGLDVAIDSDDLLIGELPTLLRLKGWIAFPHTKATVPCIHDLEAKGKVLSLVYGEEFPGLTALWQCSSPSVVITNFPPVSADIHASFSTRDTAEIFYTVDHPDKLNDYPPSFPQTLRFCPRLTEDEEHGLGNGQDEREYGICHCVGDSGLICDCCGEGYCHCPNLDCPCFGNQVLEMSNDPDAEDAYTNIVEGTLHELTDVLYLHRANACDEHLCVPEGEHIDCCPCPDHGVSNHVSLAACSSRLCVTTLDGSDFDISYENCDVAISGISPSRAFADSAVLFATNGAAYKRTNFTVLGVGFASADGLAPIEVINQKSGTLGYPVPVSTNLWSSQAITFLTDVRLTNGFVRLTLRDAQGDIALWIPEWHDDHNVYHPAEAILQSGGVTTRQMTLRQWRSVMRRYGETERLSAHVTSSRPSRCKVNFEFVSSDGEHYVHDYAEQRITSMMPVLLPDYNRDFSANLADAIELGDYRPLYFWANDDTWKDDDAFAAFDGYNGAAHPWPITLPSNGADMIVNGRNDLVNFCPFRVDLSKLVEAWGTNDVKYVLYTGNPGGVRFAPVCVGWNALDSMVKHDVATVDGGNLHSAALQTTSRVEWDEVGYEIPLGLFELADSGESVLAMEFASPGWRVLRLVAKDAESGDTLFETAVPVDVLDVHSMYRWVNLNYACNVETDPKYNTRSGVSWPDSEHADANVVFVHGYNMHPSEAWDWSQAMFKRLWWSGMDAGFTAVLWRGNESQVWVPKVPLVNESNGYASRNYHQNVLNAFRTASAFASNVNALPGAKKYMIAHSLGNMLVSAARQDYGLQYDQYFMLNAAVAVEAYDPVAGVTTNSYHDMTPKEWRAYHDFVRSTHWYELFQSDPDDERGKLTWKGRFKDVDNTINFYSSRDEVVANGSDKVDELLSREFAWYNQEQAKGSLLVSFNPQAGWKFGNHYVNEALVEGQNGETYYSYPKYTPGEAILIPATNLMVRPFFKDFRDEQIYGDGGSVFLQTNNMVRWYALSHGIPAESFAVGANPVPKWEAAGKNIDMAVYCNPAEKSNKTVKWVHSYFIGNSLFDTRKLYEELVKQIGSTQAKEEQENE